MTKTMTTTVMTLAGIGALLVGANLAGAATITVDLTKTGTATLSNLVQLDATSASTTVGTGVIDSFERLQAGPSELGYNTDANNVDDNKNGIFTHSIQFSGLDATTKPGFYTFLLDINESGNTSLLSLDDIMLFSAATGNLSQAGTPGPGATLLYNFQTATLAGSTCGGSATCTAGGAKNEILLDYNNNSGSGNGFDMFLFVPTSLFAGVKGTDFIYLYSKFGGVGSPYDSDAGFEEWARIREGGQVTPEPLSLSLVGGGLLALGLFRKRFKA